MAHVADVERALAFYEKLGLQRGDTLRGHDGALLWGSLHHGVAHIMFARASGPIDHEQQAVLFYLYTQDVRALRAHLVASGLLDAGHFGPANPQQDAREAAFELTFPPYMPGGELRVHDPDGYCLLIGQLEVEPAR